MKVVLEGNTCQRWERKFRFHEDGILKFPEINTRYDRMYTPIKLRITIEEIEDAKNRTRN